MEFSAATWIALGALLLAGIATVYAVRITARYARLQGEQRELSARLARYEHAAHQEAEERGQRADLRVSLHRSPDRIVLVNAGVGRAADVNLTAEDRNRTGSHINPRDLRRNLPIRSLASGAECAFEAFVLWDYQPTFDVRVTWTDPDGSPREFETVLYGAA